MATNLLTANALSGAGVAEKMNYPTAERWGNSLAKPVFNWGQLIFNIL